MFLSRVLIVFLVLAGAPAHAMLINAPDRAENGAVIPVEIKLNRPMSAGQRLDLLVNGELAAQVKVVEGKLSAFTTRVKGSRNPTTIVARVVANGGELDSASRNIDVGTPEPVNGSPTTVDSMKIRNESGDIKLLMSSKNGFSGPLVLQGTGFRAEISGSSILTMNPYIRVNGEFSGQITASINGQTQQAAASAAPQRQPRAAAPSASPPPTAAERVAKNYDERISTARAQCTASKDSCDTGCATIAAVGMLSVLGNKGKGNSAGEASEQIQQCTNRCDQAKSNCDQQVSSLEQEKSQAIAGTAANVRTNVTAGTTAGSPASTVSTGSSASDSRGVLGMLGGAAVAAAGGQTVAERKQLALGSLAQAGGEPGSTSNLLGSAAVAAAGGKNSTERKQLALQSLAGGEPGAPGSSTSGGTNGNTVMVPLSPPGNATSRNECLKLEWITSPLPRNKAGSTVLVDPWEFDSSPSPNKTTKQWRHLVVYSTCAESLVVTAFACEEDTMLSSGREKVLYAGRGKNAVWTAGEHAGTAFFTENSKRGVATDVRLHVAYENVTDSGNGKGRRHRAVKVFYGAWLRSELMTEGQMNENGMAYDRKLQALYRKSKEVLGIAPNLSTEARRWNPDGGDENPGVKTCAAFTAKEVWDATR